MGMKCTENTKRRDRINTHDYTVDKIYPHVYVYVYNKSNQIKSKVKGNQERKTIKRSKITNQSFEPSTNNNNNKKIKFAATQFVILIFLFVVIDVSYNKIKYHALTQTE